MRRVPEPELMEDEAQARAYAEADYGEADDRFVAAFLARFGDAIAGEVLDLGSGPGNVTLRLAAALPACTVIGVDGSAAMLAQAPATDPRVRFVHARIGRDPIPGAPFAAVVSNSLLHHLHDPGVLWRAARALGAPGSPVFVGDLRRPPSPAAAAAIVEAAARDAPEVLRRDFLASLRAAFTAAEVRTQLSRAGLGAFEVEEVGERHLFAWGRLPSTASAPRG